MAAESERLLSARRGLTPEGRLRRAHDLGGAFLTLEVSSTSADGCTEYTGWVLGEDGKVREVLESYTAWVRATEPDLQLDVEAGEAAPPSVPP